MRPMVTATRLTSIALVGVVVAVSVAGVAGCAAGPATDATSGGALDGFWQGLWHGLISPITFVVSLFTDSVAIYQVRNNGNWYDAGFMLGVSTVFSGSARSGARAQGRRQRRRTVGAASATRPKTETGP